MISESFKLRISYASMKEVRGCVSNVLVQTDKTHFKIWNISLQKSETDTLVLQYVWREWSSVLVCGESKHMWPQSMADTMCRSEHCWNKQQVCACAVPNLQRCRFPIIVVQYLCSVQYRYLQDVDKSWKLDPEVPEHTSSCQSSL